MSMAGTTPGYAALMRSILIDAKNARATGFTGDADSIGTDDFTFALAADPILMRDFEARIRCAEAVESH